MKHIIETKVARVCRKCWSCIVVLISEGREKCQMCGHEQDEPKAVTNEKMVPRF